MGKKDRRIFASLLTIGFIFTSSSTGSPQQKAENNQRMRRDTVGSVEPLRVINGLMHGRRISGQCVLQSHPSDFSLVLSKAEIVGEKLLLNGVFRLGRGTRAEQNVQVRIAGTMAKAVNPWPGPSSAVPKANTNEIETGCGVLFLSMDMNPRLRREMGAGGPSVQLGVVLAPLDNRLGEEINRKLCAIVRITGDKSNDDRLVPTVEGLNRLLASSP